jgi:hypothetical protein
LVWFQIGRLFSTRSVTVEGTQTGRQASPRPSPLGQKRLRGKQEDQADNQTTKSKLSLWREWNVVHQKITPFLRIWPRVGFVRQKCQTKSRRRQTSGSRDNHFNSTSRPAKPIVCFGVVHCEATTRSSLID